MIESQFTHAIYDTDAGELKKLTMIDVGHGDCFAISDSQGIVLYIDYGGLIDHPEKDQSGYSEEHMPVDEDRLPALILTHWDKDHYWSAKHKNQTAKKCHWLVPRQRIGPQALVFSSELERATCWPERLSTDVVVFELNSHELRIRKCGAIKRKNIQDRNLTGLAITLYDLNKKAKKNKLCVFPGDCPIDRVPNIENIPYHAVVAYHHGSKSHMNPKTLSLYKKNINHGTHLLFSFGKNHFGHPNIERYSELIPYGDCTGVTEGSSNKLRQSVSIDL